MESLSKLKTNFSANHNKYQFYKNIHRLNDDFLLNVAHMFELKNKKRRNPSTRPIKLMGQSQNFK